MDAALVDSPEHAIAAIHEDQHGVVHRSSVYGAILRLFEAMVSASRVPPLDFHLLSSLGRTSDEVSATFVATTKALEEDATRDAAREMLKRFPSYGIYYGIGSELLEAEPSPIMATIVMDAIARFCWSSRVLPTLAEIVNDPACALRAPSVAYPDKRLKLLREVWSPKLLRSCLSVVSRKERTVVATSPDAALREMIPQLSDAIFILPPDTQRELSELRMRLAVRRAELEEELVVRVYDRLCKLFKRGPLAARSWREVEEYVASQPEDVKVAPTGTDFPEILELRNEAIRFIHQVHEAPQPGSALFVRTLTAFEQQYAVSPEIRSTLGKCVAYRAVLQELDFEQSAVAVELAESRGLSIHETIEKALTDGDCLAVWASAFFQPGGPSESLLARAGSRWIICDLPPRFVMDQTQVLLPELRIVWLQGPRTRPAVGALAAIQVGDAGLLDGVVFPSSRLTGESVLLPILANGRGERLRGVGPTILTGQRSVRRMTEASEIVAWIVNTEKVLSVSGGA